MNTENIASFDIKFSTPFCVVYEGGWKMMPAKSLEEATKIAKSLLSDKNIIVAIYGKGIKNRIETLYYK